MDRKTVIYVTQTLGKKAACGIGIIGDLVAKTIVKSEKYDFRILYADGPSTVEDAITPDVVAILYHYAAGSTPWVNDTSLRNKFPDIVHIKTHHDMTQGLIDSFTAEQHGGFEYIIADDPTLVGNDNVYTTQRLIPPHVPTTTHSSDIPIIGFQGFGPPHKGIHRIASKVHSEFDEAIIRLHIPFGYYGDPTGSDARLRVQEVKDALTKPGIKVEASHELMPVADVIDMLAQNTINCYFYDYLEGAGLASAPDFALAARRPIIITRSYQFRHMWELSPSIRMEERTFADVIATGLEPLQPLYEAYTEENVIADYENILDKILSR